MNCYSCDNLITDKNKTKYELCKKCSFDPNIGITLTDVKKKYKLTEDELDDAELFCITFHSNGYSGTKYLIAEVEELAEELTKDLDNTDSRRMAYLKQRNIMSSIKKERQDLLEKKEKIREHVKALLLKLDLTCTIDHPEVIRLIDKYVKYNSLSIFDAANNVYDDIVQFQEVEKENAGRKEIIDKFLEGKLEDKYFEKAKTLNAYQKYLENKLTINQCLSQIDSYISKMTNQKNASKGDFKKYVFQ